MTLVLQLTWVKHQGNLWSGHQVLLAIVSKACCAAHPCFCVFKHMDMKRADVKKNNKFCKASVVPKLWFCFQSVCLHRPAQLTVFFMHWPKACCKELKPVLYSRGLGWASSEALQKLNWCGSQYLFSAFVPNSNFPKKMWMSNAVLTGQNLPHPVYERVSETRKQLALLWYFLYQTVQHTGTRQWSAFSNYGEHVFLKRKSRFFLLSLQQELALKNIY